MLRYIIITMVTIGMIAGFLIIQTTQTPADHNEKDPVRHFILQDSGECNFGPGGVSIRCPIGSVYINHSCTSDAPADLGRNLLENNLNDTIIPIPQCSCGADAVDGITVTIALLCAEQVIKFDFEEED